MAMPQKTRASSTSAAGILGERLHPHTAVPTARRHIRKKASPKHESGDALIWMAERGGFEPPVGYYLLRQFSKLLPSATQPPLRKVSLVVNMRLIYHSFACCQASPNKKIKRTRRSVPFWRWDGILEQRSESSCAPQRSEGAPVPTAPRRRAENGCRPSPSPTFPNAL